MAKNALRKATLDLCERWPAALSGREAKSAIRQLIRMTGATKGDMRAFWSDPEEHLGPFEALPRRTRQALRHAAEYELKENSLTVSDGLYRVIHGPVLWLGSALAELRWPLRFRGWPISVRKRVQRLGGKLNLTCVWLGHRWLDLIRFTRFSRSSLVHALWKYVGVNPSVVINSYIDRINIEPRLNPVCRAPDGNVESCALIGLDLLPSNDQLFYLEANFNHGIRGRRRLRLFPDEDPLCAALIRYALERELKRIVFYPSSMVFFPGELEQKWIGQAEASGLQLEIRDDPYLRSPYGRDWNPFMDFRAEGTLYVNGRPLPSPLRTVVSRKGYLEAEIERFNFTVAPEERIRLPKVIRTPDDLPACDPEAPFPNLILKDPFLDMARGISLYKLDRVPYELLSPASVAFEFIRSDSTSPDRDGAAYSSKFRALLLLTANGPRYAGAGRNISLAPIPARLPHGEVADRVPFVVNSHLGTRGVLTRDWEQELIRKTVLKIGNVLWEFVQRKHAMADAPIFADSTSPSPPVLVSH